MESGLFFLLDRAFLEPSDSVCSAWSGGWKNDEDHVYLFYPSGKHPAIIVQPKLERSKLASFRTMDSSIPDYQVWLC